MAPATCVCSDRLRGARRASSATWICSCRTTGHTSPWFRVGQGEELERVGREADVVPVRLDMMKWFSTLITTAMSGGVSSFCWLVIGHVAPRQGRCLAAVPGRGAYGVLLSLAEWTDSVTRSSHYRTAAFVCWNVAALAVAILTVVVLPAPLGLLR